MGKRKQLGISSLGLAFTLFSNAVLASEPPGNVSSYEVAMSVNLALSRLDPAATHVRVSCILSGSNVSSTGHTEIALSNGNYFGPAEVPIYATKPLIDYESVQCSLSLCNERSGNLTCNTPMDQSSIGGPNNQYLAFDASTPHSLESSQELSDSFVLEITPPETPFTVESSTHGRTASQPKSLSDKSAKPATVKVASAPQKNSTSAKASPKTAENTAKPSWLELFPFSDEELAYIGDDPKKASELVALRGANQSIGGDEEAEAAAIKELIKGAGSKDAKRRADLILIARSGFIEVDEKKVLDSKLSAKDLVSIKAATESLGLQTDSEGKYVDQAIEEGSTKGAMISIAADGFGINDDVAKGFGSAKDLVSSYAFIEQMGGDGDDLNDPKVAKTFQDFKSGKINKGKFHTELNGLGIVPDGVLQGSGSGAGGSGSGSGSGAASGSGTGVASGTGTRAVGTGAGKEVALVIGGTGSGSGSGSGGGTGSGSGSGSSSGSGTGTGTGTAPAATGAGSAPAPANTSPANATPTKAAPAKQSAPQQSAPQQNQGSTGSSSGTSSAANNSSSAQNTSSSASSSSGGSSSGAQSASSAAANDASSGESSAQTEDGVMEVYDAEVDTDTEGNVTGHSWSAEIRYEADADDRADGVTGSSYRRISAYCSDGVCSITDLDTGEDLGTIPDEGHKSKGDKKQVDLPARDDGDESSTDETEEADTQGTASSEGDSDEDEDCKEEGGDCGSEDEEPEGEKAAEEKDTEKEADSTPDPRDRDNMSEGIAWAMQNPGHPLAQQILKTAAKSVEDLSGLCQAGCPGATGDGGILWAMNNPESPLAQEILANAADAIADNSGDGQQGGRDDNPANEPFNAEVSDADFRRIELLISGGGVIDPPEEGGGSNGNPDAPIGNGVPIGGGAPATEGISEDTGYNTDSLQVRGVGTGGGLDPDDPDNPDGEISVDTNQIQSGGIR